MTMVDIVNSYAEGFGTIHQLPLVGFQTFVQLCQKSGLRHVSLRVRAGCENQERIIKLDFIRCGFAAGCEARLCLAVRVH